MRERIPDAEVAKGTQKTQKNWFFNELRGERAQLGTAHAQITRCAGRRGRRCAVQARMKGQSPERPVPAAEHGYESAAARIEPRVCFMLSRHLLEWSSWPLQRTGTQRVVPR